MMPKNMTRPTNTLLLGALFGALSQMAYAQDHAEGKKTYDSLCFACHATAVANAPKLGDQKAWQPRLKQGVEALYATAIKGKNAMPPKGGATHLSDEQIKQAVDYMVSTVEQ